MGGRTLEMLGEVWKFSEVRGRNFGIEFGRGHSRPSVDKSCLGTGTSGHGLSRGVGATKGSIRGLIGFLSGYFKGFLGVFGGS